VIERRARRALLLCLCAVAALSVHCSSADSGPGGADASVNPDGAAPLPEDGGVPVENDAGPPAPYTLSLTPANLTVAQGRGGQVTVSIVRSATFAGPVKLQLDGLPAGVTATPLTLTNSATTGVFSLSANPNAALATSTLTIRGVASGTDIAVPYALRVVGPPGALDTTFGTGGKVLTSLGGPKNDKPSAALVQKDGKVVVVGTSDQGTSLDFALVRYNVDGSLDAAFGTAGVALTNFDYAQDTAYAATFDSLGRIVVVGTSATNTTALALARYTADGNLDTSFGIDGKLTTIVTGTADIPTSIIADGAGRFVVGLRVLNPSPPSTYRYRAVRFDALGQVDATFGSPTGALTSQTFGYRRGLFLLPQSADRVVALTNSTYGTQGNSCSSFALERLSGAGAPDTTFGTGGYTYTRFGANCNYPDAIGVQADGKLLAVGTSSSSNQNRNENLSSPRDFALSRYSADGVIDTTFGKTGALTISAAGKESRAAGVVEQKDKKVVFLGWASAGYGPANFVTARFLADGAPDPEFGFGDLVQLDFDNSSDDYASALALLPDDRIVVVGSSNNRFALARYWP
jgi:uncharacterized delta-60 repeat protein